MLDQLCIVKLGAEDMSRLQDHHWIAYVFLDAEDLVNMRCFSLPARFAREAIGDGGAEERVSLQQGVNPLADRGLQRLVEGKGELSENDDDLRVTGLGLREAEAFVDACGEKVGGESVCGPVERTTGAHTHLSCVCSLPSSCLCFSSRYGRWFR